MQIDVVKNMAGGDGEVTICRLLGEKELNGKCGLYAQVTIQPGSSLGYHVHHNESETYYILSGEAEYNDNGTPRMVKAGDVIEVREKSKSLAIVAAALEAGTRDFPGYLEVDAKKMTAKYSFVPKFADIPYAAQMEPNLVIEYYSR